MCQAYPRPNADWALLNEPCQMVRFSWKTFYVNIGTFAIDMKMFIIRLKMKLKKGKTLKQNFKNLAYLLLGSTGSLDWNVILIKKLISSIKKLEFNPPIPWFILLLFCLVTTHISALGLLVALLSEIIPDEAIEGDRNGSWVSHVQSKIPTSLFSLCPPPKKTSQLLPRNNYFPRISYVKNCHCFYYSLKTGRSDSFLWVYSQE